MAGLADQVSEMMRILELVDPQAAARIRGAVANVQPAANIPVVSFPSVIAPAAVSAPVPAPDVREMKVTPPVSPAPLHLSGLAADTLTQGIIWSEILGKPVSRRKRW